MYEKNPKGWRKHLDFIVLDVIYLELAFFFAFYIRHHHFGIYQVEEYRNLAVLMALMDLVVIFFTATMSGVLRRGYFQEFKRTLYHVLAVMMMVCVYLYAIKTGEAYSRLVIGYTGILYMIFSYVGRLIWKKYLVEHVKVNDSRSLLLITTRKKVEEAVEYLVNHNYEQYHICGVVVVDAGENEIKENICNIPVLAGKEAALEYARQEWVDEALIVSDTGEEEMTDLIEKFGRMGITVHIRLFTAIKMLPEQYVEKINGMTVLTNSSRYVTRKQLFYKRCLDLAGGIVGSILAVVILIIVGPIIYIQSPGPILFKQTRVGRSGKKFTMYKIRSMYLDAEERKAEIMKEHAERDSRMFKLEFDPRIIGCKMRPDGTMKKGIGNFIRDLSLDEFPQFFNVLKGDMSLVGTRPPTVDEWEQYEYHHRSRLAIKPGITGKWQASGRSNIADFEEVVRLDQEYIQEWNIGQDIKLILKTIVNVIKREGAM